MKCFWVAHKILHECEKQLCHLYIFPKIVSRSRETLKRVVGSSLDIE